MKSTRVKVTVHNEIRINLEYERNSFFLINNDFKKIADLRYRIIRKLGITNCQSEFYLSIEGFLIRSNETINILRDNDCILLSLSKENITKRKKDIYDNTIIIKQKRKKRKKEEFQELYEDVSSLKLLKIPKKIKSVDKKTKILSKKNIEKNKNDIDDKNIIIENKDKIIINIPTPVNPYVDSKSMWNYLNENQSRGCNIENNFMNSNMGYKKPLNTIENMNNIDKKVIKNVKSKLRSQQLATATKSIDPNVDGIYSNKLSTVTNRGKWNEDNDNYTLYPLVMEYSSLKVIIIFYY
jgi:hypothetical protein